MMLYNLSNQLLRTSPLLFVSWAFWACGAPAPTDSKGEPANEDGGLGGGGVASVEYAAPGIVLSEPADSLVSQNGRVITARKGADDTVELNSFRVPLGSAPKAYVLKLDHEPQGPLMIRQYTGATDLHVVGGWSSASGQGAFAIALDDELGVLGTASTSSSAGWVNPMDATILSNGQLTGAALVGEENPIPWFLKWSGESEGASEMQLEAKLPEDLVSPLTIGSDYHKNVHLLAHSPPRVVRYDEDGAQLPELPIPGDFTELAPSLLAVTPSGEGYVVALDEAGNSTPLRYQADGKMLRYQTFDAAFEFIKILAYGDNLIAIRRHHYPDIGWDILIDEFSSSGDYLGGGLMTIPNASELIAADVAPNGRVDLLIRTVDESGKKADSIFSTMEDRAPSSSF